jgi:hypothetical protein
MNLLNDLGMGHSIVFTVQEIKMVVIQCNTTIYW